MLLLLLLLLSSFTWAKQCSNVGEFKTNHDTRVVYRCTKDGKWGFHAKLLRPRENEAPLRAYIALQCPLNPDLNGPIAGFICDTTHHEMHLLNCLNTKIIYMCHFSRWSIYQVLNK